MARLLMVSVVLVVISTGLASGFLQTTRRYSTSNCIICLTPTLQTHTTQYMYPYWPRRTTRGPTPTAVWFWSRRTTSTPPPTADWFWTRRTTTMPPTTTRFCPYACTFRGVHYCYPVACHITCVDGNRPPGACCYECPNGPNCSYNGHIIPEGQYITTSSGAHAYCQEGGPTGGDVDVRQPTTP